MDNSNGLGKLLPKSITKRRRKKQRQGTEGPQDHDDDYDRRRSVTSQMESDGTDSLNVGEDDGSKSLGSFESDPDREQ